MKTDPATCRPSDRDQALQTLQPFIFSSVSGNNDCTPLRLLGRDGNNDCTPVRLLGREDTMIQVKLSVQWLAYGSTQRIWLFEEPSKQ